MAKVVNDIRRGVSIVNTLFLTLTATVNNNVVESTILNLPSDAFDDRSRLVAIFVNIVFACLFVRGVQGGCVLFV